MSGKQSSRSAPGLIAAAAFLIIASLLSFAVWMVGEHRSVYGLVPPAFGAAMNLAFAALLVWRPRVWVVVIVVLRAVVGIFLCLRDVYTIKHVFGAWRADPITVLLLIAVAVQALVVIAVFLPGTGPALRASSPERGLYGEPGDTQ